MTHSRIKAIVFDLGGVLFAEGKSIALERLSNNYNYEKEVVKNIITSPQSYELRKGLIAEDAFWQWAQEQLPEGYDAEIIKNVWYDGYVLDEDIFHLLKQFAPNYTLIAFSGNIKGRIKYLDAKYDFRKWFDVEIYSYEHHYNKGEKGFVEVLIQESGYAPQEMVYIDNKEEAVEAARQFDISSILYKQGAIRELKQRLKEEGVR